MPYGYNSDQIGVHKGEAKKIKLKSGTNVLPVMFYVLVGVMEVYA